MNWTNFDRILCVEVKTFFHTVPNLKCFFWNLIRDNLKKKLKKRNFFRLKIKISKERRRKNRKKRKDQKITAENQEKKKRKRRRGRSQRRNAKILSTFRKWRVSRYVRKLIKQLSTFVQTLIRQHTYEHSAHVCTDTNQTAHICT